MSPPPGNRNRVSRPQRSSVRSSVNSTPLARSSCIVASTSSHMKKSSCAGGPSEGCIATSAGGSWKIRHPPPASTFGCPRTSAKKVRSASGSRLNSTTWLPLITRRRYAARPGEVASEELGGRLFTMRGAAGGAAERLAGLAVPAGALGRLGELGVWVASAQGTVPPQPLDNVRLVIFAGDHGVAGHGVSAYPAAITPAMVRTFAAGKAGVSALAAAHDVHVRVLDLGVDDDLSDLPVEVRAQKVRRSSGAIHLEDALTPEETRRAIEAGRAVAREEIAAGAQLLLSGDMGIGNTSPGAALVAAALGLPASEVTGRGTGVDEETLV